MRRRSNKNSFKGIEQVAKALSLEIPEFCKHSYRNQRARGFRLKFRSPTFSPLHRQARYFYEVQRAARKRSPRNLDALAKKKKQISAPVAYRSSASREIQLADFTFYGWIRCVVCSTAKGITWNEGRRKPSPSAKYWEATGRGNEFFLRFTHGATFCLIFFAVCWCEINTASNARYGFSAVAPINYRLSHLNIAWNNFSLCTDRCNTGSNADSGRVFYMVY